MIRIFFLALAALLATTAHAEAGFIVGAIAAISSLMAAGGIAGTLIKLGLALALNIGLTLLQRALQPRQKPPGVKFEEELGEDADIGFVVGDYATAGTRKYVGTWGNDNAYFVRVIQLGDLPAPGEPEVWLNGEKLTVLWNETPADQGYPVEEYRVGGKDHFWVKYRDGTETSADAYLLDKFGSHPDRPWTSDMIGRGAPHLIFTARFNRDLFQGQFQVVVQPPPVPLYDLRDDSTNGGHGLQRWTNPSTRQPTRNPVIIIYNIIRGLYYGVPGDGEWLYGGQNLPAFRLPPSNWIAAANECDVEIDLDGGGTEPQFRAGYEVRGSIEPWSVIEELLKACNGRLSTSGGVFKITVGAPPAPVYSFTDDDILITEGQSLDPFPTLDNTVNGIEARYPEPGEGWALKDAPARYSSNLEEDDKGRRLATGIVFDACPHGVQVQRLMKAILEEERRFIRHAFHLPPEAWPLEPNDVVAWTSPRNGYTNKKFIVEYIDGERSENQAIVLKEVEPGEDHDWNPATDEQPISVGFLGPIRAAPQAMVGWQVAPATIRDASNNARRPSIQITYSGDQEDVSDVLVRVRLAADESIVFFGKIPYGPPDQASKSVVLNGTFLPDTEYEAQGEFVPFSGRATTPSDWLPVTTPDVKLGGLDVFFDVNVEEIQDAVENATAWLQEPVRFSVTNIRDLIESSFIDARFNIDADFEMFEGGEQQSRELRATYDRITTEYTEEITVVANDLGGAVQRVETLEVRADDPEIGFEALANTSSQQLSMIEANEGAITVVSQRTDTTEAALDGYLGANAVATAFSSQLSLIEANEDSITVVSQRTDTTEAALSGYLGANAVANTFSNQLSLIEANEDSITVVAERTDTTEAALSGFLGANAVSNTFSQQLSLIEANEDSIIIVSQRVDTTEAALSGYLGANAVASGFSGQLSMIEANEDGITVLSSRADTTEAALFGYLGANAVANAFSGQLSLIEANEDEINVLSADVTQVQAALSGYLGSSAVADAFTLHQAQITANENSITSNATAVTQVEASLAGVKRWTYIANVPEGGTKLRNQDGSAPLEHSSGNATMGRLYTIEARRITGSGAGSTVARARKPNANDPWQVEVVFTAGNPSTNQPQVFIDGDGDPAIRNTADNATDYEVTIEKTSMNTNDARANALGVFALDARVTQTEDDIVANATAVLGVEASVDEVSAEGGFKAEVQASPGGGWSNVGLYARAGSSATGSFQQASIFLQARSSGSPRSRAALVADEIVFTDGSGFYRPVVIQGGQLIADELLVNWANIINADIQWANIDNAVIGNLTVIDGMIPAGLITETNSDTRASSSIDQGLGSLGPWVTVMEMVLDNLSGNPLMLNYLIVCSASRNQSIGAAVEARVRMNGSIISGPYSHSVPPDTGSPAQISVSRFFMVNTSPGTTTVDVQCRAGGVSGTALAGGQIIGQINRH